MARLHTIWIKRGKRAPMDRVDVARLEPSVGLVGNANAGGRRQVTVLDHDRWREVCADLGEDVDPALRRANLLVEGIELEGSRGRMLRVGPARIRIGGETTPCRLMDEQHAGLQEALRSRWRGGVYGIVEIGGAIRPGDPVAWDVESPSEEEEEAEDAPSAR